MRKIDQAKLYHWAGLIHECQNSGLKKKEWLAQNGISKDTYYYWYKRVQEACVDAMEIPDTLPMTEFVSLPVITESTMTAEKEPIDTIPSVVTVHVGKVTIDIPETTSVEFIQKLIGALAYVE